MVLQLGGSDPETLAHAVRLASPWSYDEINLNCRAAERAEPSRAEPCRLRSGVVSVVQLTTSSRAQNITLLAGDGKALG